METVNHGTPYFVTWNYYYLKWIGKNHSGKVWELRHTRKFMYTNVFRCQYLCLNSCALSIQLKSMLHSVTRDNKNNITTRRTQQQQHTLKNTQENKLQGWYVILQYPIYQNQDMEPQHSTWLTYELLLADVDEEYQKDWYQQPYNMNSSSTCETSNIVDKHCDALFSYNSKTTHNAYLATVFSYLTLNCHYSGQFISIYRRKCLNYL